MFGEARQFRALRAVFLMELSVVCLPGFFLSFIDKSI
jgi:hypothetical protein